MNKIPLVIRNYWKYYLVLLGCILIVYIPTINFDIFLIDDRETIFLNPLLQSLSLQNIFKIWTTSKTPIFPSVSTILLYLGNGQPIIFYLFNILIHFFNSSIVLYIAYKVFPYIFKQITKEENITLAFFTALLFGIHPIQVQAVSWINELRTLLATFFVLISFTFFLNLQQKELNYKNFFFFFIFYILAMLTKPLVISYALLIIAYTVIFDKTPLTNRIIKTVPISILTIFTAVIHISDELKMNDQVSPMSERVLAFFYTNIQYLAKIIFPINLKFVYPIYLSNFSNIITEQRALVFLLIIFIAFLLTWALLKKQVYILSLILFFIIIQLPTSGLINFNFQLVSLIADRYVYLGMVVASLLISTLAYTLFKKFAWSKLLALPIIIILMILSIRYVHYRANTKQLLYDTTKANKLYDEIYAIYLLQHNNFFDLYDFINERPSNVASSVLLEFIEKINKIEAMKLENIPIDDDDKISEKPNWGQYALTLYQNKLLSAKEFITYKIILLDPKEQEKIKKRFKKDIEIKKDNALLTLGDFYMVNNQCAKGLSYYLQYLQAGNTIKDTLRQKKLTECVKQIKKTQPKQIMNKQ